MLYVSRVRSHAACQAPRGELRVDEPRVVRLEAVVVQPELLERLQPDVGHEDVRVGEQLLEDGAALLGLDVQSDPALAAVVLLDCMQPLL